MSEGSRHSWTKLVALFQAMHDGTATTEEADKLSVLLVEDARARSLFAEYSHVRAGLELMHGGQQRHSLLADDGIDNEANDEMIVCLGELLELEESADFEIARLDDNALENAPAESPAQFIPPEQASLRTPSARVIVVPKLVFYGGIAALLMVCGLVLSAYLINRPSSQDPASLTGQETNPNEQTGVAGRPNPYGRVIDSIGAVWDDAPVADSEGPTLSPDNGELYKDVPYSLQQGYARVLMEDGAVIIFQSPCNFVLEGPGKIRILNGKVVCLCETESSKGLVVNTPSARIVDLGTEFGVRVDPDTGVHATVFQGVIALTSAKLSDAPEEQPGSEFILKSGNAISVDTVGRIVDAPEDQVSFVRDAEYVSQRRIGDTPHSKKRLYDRQVLEKMDGLELFYSFDGNAVQNGAIRNQAQNGLKRLTGRVVGAVQPVSGRFGEHDLAMRFGGAGQDEGWIEVDPSQEDAFDFTGSFSVSLWVKTDSLPNRWRPVIIKGDRSWRVQSGNLASAEGALQFEAGEMREGEPFHSVYNTQRIDDGHWHAWAVVYEQDPDGLLGSVTTYVNGRVVAKKQVDIKLPNTDDPVCIGNIGPGFRTSPVDAARQFVGEIDDICVFSRALTKQEIETLHLMHRHK